MEQTLWIFSLDFFLLEDSKLRQLQIVNNCFYDLAFETSLDE